MHESEVNLQIGLVMDITMNYTMIQVEKVQEIQAKILTPLSLKEKDRKGCMVIGSQFKFMWAMQKIVKHISYSAVP